MRTALYALALSLIAAACATTTNQPGDTGQDTGMDPGDTLAEDVPADDPGEDAACPTGETRCGADCADLLSDPGHCGTCEIACTPDGPNMDVTCTAGECGSACMEGWWDRTGEPGCEYPCTFSSSTEICNGVDDNCDGNVDEGYPCGFGLPTACTTTCDSRGTGICGLGCTIPAPEECTPPEEICNGVDEDCDTLVDDGFAPGVCDCAPDCTGRECGPDPVCFASCGDCDPLTEICDSTGNCQCVPDCYGRECGPDPVCGTSCGTCTPPDACNGSGTCETPCSPDCWGRNCGPDPVCGTSCGTCTPPSVCNASGACVASCVPDCTGRNCGPDPVCGTSCGTCTPPMTCDLTGNCASPTCLESPCGLVPNCGCGPGMKCSLVGSGSTVTRACVAAGTGARGTSCLTDANCAAGTICLEMFSTIGSTEAACYPFCDSEADCMGDAAVCYQAFTGSTESICSLGCNLATGSGCPAGAKCLLFELTGTGQPLTDCTGDAGTGTVGAHCTDEASCAVGHYCYSGPPAECVGYCTITPFDSCIVGCQQWVDAYGIPVTYLFDGMSFGYCYY